MMVLVRGKAALGNFSLGAGEGTSQPTLCLHCSADDLEHPARDCCPSWQTHGPSGWCQPTTNPAVSGGHHHSPTRVSASTRKKRCSGQMGTPVSGAY